MKSCKPELDAAVRLRALVGAVTTPGGIAARVSKLDPSEILESSGSAMLCPASTAARGAARDDRPLSD